MIRNLWLIICVTKLEYHHVEMPILWYFFFNLLLYFTLLNTICKLIPGTQFLFLFQKSKIVINWTLIMSEKEGVITVKIHVYPLHGKKMTMAMKCLINEIFMLMLFLKKQKERYSVIILHCTVLIFFVKVGSKHTLTTTY